MKYLMFILTVCFSYSSSLLDVELEFLSKVEEFESPKYSYSMDDWYRVDKLKEEKVRIGIQKENSYYFHTSAQGENYGKVAFFSKALEKHFGFEVEYVYDTWDNLYQKLVDGSIDIFMGMTVTKNREEVIDFTRSYQAELGTVYTPANHEVNSFEDFSGKKIYVQNASIFQEILGKKMDLFDFDLIPVSLHNFDLVDEDSYIFDTETHISNLLVEGRRGIKASSFYSFPPVSIGVNREKSDLLLPLLDKFLEQQLGELLIIHNKRARESLRKELLRLNLDKDELEFIGQIPQLKFYIEEELYPYTFYNKESSQYEGIFVEILEEVALGLDIDIKLINHQQSSKDIRAKGLDKDEVVLLAKTRIRDKQYDFAKELYRVELMLIGHKENRLKKGSRFNYFGVDIGVVKDDIGEEVASTFFRGDNIKVYDTEKKLLDGYRRGEVEYFLATREELAYMQKFKYHTDIIAIDKITELPITFALQKGNDKLLSIINKTLDYYIDKEVKYERWESYPNDTGARLKMLNNILAIFLASGVVVIIMLNKKTKYIKEQKNYIEQLALFDSLTKCRNRICLEKDILEYRTLNYGGLLIDIRNFKKINKYHTRQVGDDVLVTIAKLTREFCDAARVYRLAGDEFFVMYSDINKEELIQVAQDLDSVYKSNEFGIEVEVKLGIAYSNDFNSLLESCQQALYLAKLSKKQNYVVADEETIVRYLEEIELKNNLIKAIERREFSPYFQPKIDLSTNKIVSCEALARWIKDKKLIFPDKFIPIAESVGLIPKLDVIIISETFKQLKEWIRDDLIGEGFSIAINLSIKSIEKEHFLDEIKYLLDKYNIESKYIEFEVTESVFVSNIDHVVGVINQLKRMGFSISIDDFSAGHSSTKMLNILPVDIIKFDRSLLFDTESDSRKLEIYKALVRMAKSLKLKCVAEGVESLEQVEVLKKLEVDIAQGYYYSKPICKNSFKKLLITNKI